jgi:phosphatidate cytidylyltransferase
MDEVVSTLGRAKLLPRTMTAVIGGAVFLTAAWAGGIWWVAVMVTLALLTGIEYAALHSQMTYRGQRIRYIPILFVVLTATGLWSEPLFLIFGAIVLVGGVVPWLARGMEPRQWYQPAWLIFIQGIAYVSLPLGVLGRWRLQGTFAELLWFFVIVWAGDIAAYFVGLLFGRHKLAPHVSPGKSWEGAAAGLGAGGIAGLLAAPTFGLAGSGGLALGIVTSVAAQIGDLFESALKRRAGVKDSGVLLPGHGGVLDRFDAAFFAAPVAYFALKMWGRI